MRSEDQISSFEPSAGDEQTRFLGERRPRLTPFPPEFYALPDIEESSVNRTIWRDWVAATTLAGALATTAGGLLVVFGTQVDDQPLPNLILAGPLVGLIVGLIQGRALRPYLPPRALGGWVAANTLAGVIGGALAHWFVTYQSFTVYVNTAEAPGQMEGAFSGLDQIFLVIALRAGPLLHISPFAIYDALRNLAPLINGLLFGLLLGVAQWLVLRAYLPRAGWWVLASAVGGIGAAVVLPVVGFPVYLLFYGTFFCLGTPAGLLLGAAVALPVGILTGTVLVRLVGRPPRPAPTELITARLA